MIAAAVGIALTVAVAWTSGGWAKIYGSPGSPNGGVVVGIRRQACLGVELWGAPGVFGSLTDAGGCDL
jgi:hypothetical protein